MNRKTKWSQRILALAMAAMMCCSVFPVGAFAETPPPQESMVAAEEQQTDETETDNGQTDASSPDPGAATEESAAPTTDEPSLCSSLRGLFQQTPCRCRGQSTADSE